MTEEIDCPIDLAYQESQNMWLNLGREIKKTIEDTEYIGDANHARELISLAALSEACFWQHTGDNDTINIQSLLGDLSKVGVKS